MNWPALGIEELCEINIGRTPDRNNLAFWSGDNTWLSIADLNGSQYVEKSKEAISDKAVKDCKCKPVPENTVVFSFKLSIGKIAITSKTLFTNEAIAAFPIKDAKRIDTKYLYFYLKSIDASSLGDKAVKGITLNKEKLRKIKIPLPPLPIQKKIAAVLDKADSLKQNNKQLLEHYNQLTQSIFYEMFGYNGQLESKYEKLPLSSVSEIVSGVTLNSKNVNPEWRSYPYLRVFNVQDGFFDLSEIKQVKVSQAEFDRYVLKKNDILLTEGGDPDKLGRGSIWNSEINNCVHQNHIFRVRIMSEDYHPVFISSLLGSTYGKKYFLKAAKQTTGIASINSTQLKAFPLIKPSFSLQKKFSSVIQKTNEAKEHAKINIDKSEHLFQSLLQKAFKGELVKEP